MISQKLYLVSFLEYLTSIWALISFNRGCDICKDFRVENLSRRENRGRLTLTVKDELSGLFWAMKNPLETSPKFPRGNERR
jgi:hypothetical protein